MPESFSPVNRSRALLACLACLVTASAGIGCSTDSTAFYASRQALQSDDRPVLTNSLFTADDLVATDEAVQTILNSKVLVPEQSRVAVVLLGDRPSWWGWNKDIARDSDRIYNEFLTSLESHENILAAEYVPRLLMPQSVDISSLRLAALRMRCDFLLVYTTRTGEYTDDKLFGTDVVRAHAAVESLLIDVRTGTVPSTSVITGFAERERVRDDKKLNDARERAQLAATEDAWQQMATDAKDYFDQAEKGDPEMARAAEN